MPKGLLTPIPTDCDNSLTLIFSYLNMQLVRILNFFTISSKFYKIKFATIVKMKWKVSPLPLLVKIPKWYHLLA